MKERPSIDQVCHMLSLVLAQAFLTGMPEVKIGLNEKLSDVKLHQSVNLARFEAERVVSFVPPDGEFELMSYRCSDGIALPFRVLPVVTERNSGHLEVRIKPPCGQTCPCSSLLACREDRCRRLRLCRFQSGSVTGVRQPHAEVLLGTGRLVACHQWREACAWDADTTMVP